MQLKRLQDDCNDDDDSNWMNPADGEESNCNSTENTLSPDITCNLRKILSSSSSDSDVQTHLANELRGDGVHTPIKVTVPESVCRPSSKSKSTPEISKHTSTLPLRP